MQGKHLRELRKAGKTAKYGSFVYSADELSARGILLSVDASAQAHWSHLKLSISSDEEGALRPCGWARLIRPGVFVLRANVAGINATEAVMSWDDMCVLMAPRYLLTCAGVRCATTARRSSPSTGCA